MNQSCQADRIPIYEHAREVAAALAERAQPVHVAEAAPLDLAEASAEHPSPLYLAKLPRVGDAKPKKTFQKRDGAPMRETAREAGPNPAIPNRAKKNGRPAITEQRASTIQRHRANGEPYWIAQIRGANNARTYLGPHRTREHALAACERFIATGEKPPALQRGMKAGQRQMPVTPKRHGAQTAKRAPTSLAKAPPAPKRSTASPKAASGQEGPRTTWREIAARFQ